MCTTFVVYYTTYVVYYTTYAVSSGFPILLNEDEIQTVIDNSEEFLPNNEEWIVGLSGEQWFLKNVLHRYMDQ